MRTSRPRVFVFGAGKVGTVLASRLRAAGLGVSLRAARGGWPRGRITADVVVLAVRDRALASAASELARASLVGHCRRRVAVLHCAGALGPEVLAAVRGPTVAVGQMHPLVALASPSAGPALTGAMLLVRGDDRAVRAARQIGRRLGMRVVEAAEVDLALYHTAAALVAGGSAALAAEGGRLLGLAGLSPAHGADALAHLLRSVADNLARLGLPAALTGPTRRGDHLTVAGQLAALERQAPELIGLHCALLRTQLRLARELGEARPADLRRVMRLVEERSTLGKKRQLDRKNRTGKRVKLE